MHVTCQQVLLARLAVSRMGIAPMSDDMKMIQTWKRVFAQLEGIGAVLPVTTTPGL